MKIQKHDLYHGAALTQIVQHESFTALNKASSKYGHYLVNTNRHVFIKYRTERASPWLFNLQADDIASLHKELRQSDKIFLCLVCGDVTICALDKQEISELVDFSKKQQQWINIEIPQGGSCHVNSVLGKLKRTIPHNSYPSKVLN